MSPSTASAAPARTAPPATQARAARPGDAGPTVRDGRSTRWEAHRRTRRAELVSAAVRAISVAGPDVGMDEIAALAGTSKTVLYRHFADKHELHTAVAERVDQRVSAALAASSAGAQDFRSGLRSVIATYLHLVTDDPHLYRFVTARTAPSGADPVAGLTAAVSAELTRLIGKHLRAGGLARSVSATWAHGLVGMVRAGVDHWLSEPDPALDVEGLTNALTDLAWGGLAPSLEPTVPSRPSAPAAPAGAAVRSDPGPTSGTTSDTDVTEHQEQP